MAIGLGLAIAVVVLSVVAVQVVAFLLLRQGQTLPISLQGNRCQHVLVLLPAERHVHHIHSMNGCMPECALSTPER